MKYNLVKTITLSLISITTFVSLNSQACDTYLSNYLRDCQIQDNYMALKTEFAKMNINIEKIAAYRVPRFIDRNSWTKAIQKQTPINQIYSPAPDTWNVWNNGINNLFLEKYDYTHYVFNNPVILSLPMLKQLNQNLISKNISDSTKAPGELRNGSDSMIGYCETNYTSTSFQKLITYLNNEIDNELNEWQAGTGITLANIAAQEGVTSSQINKLKTLRSQNNLENDSILNLHPTLELDTQNPTYCSSQYPQYKNIFLVLYSPSAEVETRLQILLSFIKANMNLYKNNKPAMSPIKLISLVQKIFVSIHPFGDGNGRTSRALQDLLTLNFGLPYVVGGDLQDDVTSTFDAYTRNTYTVLENTNSALSDCYWEYKNHQANKNSPISFACQIVQ